MKWSHLVFAAECLSARNHSKAWCSSPVIVIFWKMQYKRQFYRTIFVNFYIKMFYLTPRLFKLQFTWETFAHPHVHVKCFGGTEKVHLPSSKSNTEVQFFHWNDFEVIYISSSTHKLNGLKLTAHQRWKWVNIDSLMHLEEAVYLTVFLSFSQKQYTGLECVIGYILNVIWLNRLKGLITSACWKKC